VGWIDPAKVGKPPRPVNLVGPLEGEGREPELIYTASTLRKSYGRSTLTNVPVAYTVASTSPTLAQIPM